MKFFWMRMAATILAASGVATQPTMAWDSAKFEMLSRVVHPTHSYMTEFAIDQLAAEFPELSQYGKALVDGANQELHELPVEGSLYGLDLDKKRRQHKGTNAGSDDVEGWWNDAKAAYEAGNKEQAYFITGIMLHMIEDMGVPAHANGIYHQGTLTEFDNFEAMGLQKWDPDFKRVDREDPAYWGEPWRYYAFSQNWAATDAPDYKDRDSFSKTWLTASSKEKQLVRNRQARTATTAMWALRVAVADFMGL